MFVCIYVAIYFRAWYDGCGHENVRISPGSAPADENMNSFSNLRSIINILLVLFSKGTLSDALEGVTSKKIFARSARVFRAYL